MNIRIFSCFLFFLLFGIDPHHVFPQSAVFPPPNGIYCSCGPTTASGSGSVAVNISSKPFVQGILVRIGWNTLEPDENNFKWSLLDTQIIRARNFGKKVSLAFGCGPAIPKWVFDKNAKPLIINIPVTDTIAIPWDSTFLVEWSKFIRLAGNRYKNDTTISLVYITNSTGNGYEMQINASPSVLTAAGYSDLKMTASWKKIIDAFKIAFPNHYLTNDFHPVNFSNSVSDSVFAYANSVISGRYGASAWWWTQKNTTVYPEQFNILKSSSENNPFSGIQMAYSGLKDSAAFGSGGMPVALQLAMSLKICYWEFWNQDLLSPKFDSLFSAARCSGTSSLNNEASGFAKDFIIYPNPATNILHFISPFPVKFIKIFNPIGEEQLLPTNLSNSEINLTLLPKGLYFIYFMGIKQNFIIKKIIRL